MGRVQDELGGILGLLTLLDERWEALEADFADTYTTDLATALWVDGMSMRRLDVLVRGLDPSSRVSQPENWGWTVGDYHRALVAEQTNAVMRAVLATAPSKRRRKLPDPLVIKRPPGPKAKPKRQSWFETIASVVSRKRR